MQVWEFTKSLGVYIDKNLSWDLQIKSIFQKIASGIGILRHSRSFVPFETWISNSLVQSHFDYCSVAWGNCNKPPASKLKKTKAAERHY